MIQETLEQTFLGNQIVDYIMSLCVLLVTIVIIKIVQHSLLKHLKKFAEKTQTSVDDFLINVLNKLVLPLSYFGALYLAINALKLTPFISKILNILGISILVVFITRFVTILITYAFNIYIRKTGKDESMQRTMKGILNLIKISVWGLAIVFFLDNLGFKISAVIAGLGIGGVAVALAAQAVLGDLFSFFAILFDRPFLVGDFIIVGDYLGVVEKIGIKTTRISSLSGEQLVFSNSDLTNSRIRNYKKMEKRRVVFKLGVTYNTPLEKMKKIPVLIESIVKGQKDTAFDRAHFFSYGDFSLVIEVVYYVIGNDYNKYMNIQQNINLEIMEKFQELGIQFAYPTQTLYVNNTNNTK